MKYKNAKSILPEKLLQELQRYVGSGYLYIPAGQGQRKKWGELSGYRKELEQRNRQILAEHRAGVAIETLAEKYCLSESAIRKILYRRSTKM